MTKQPCLTGLSTTVLASQQRVKQARIRKARRELVEGGSCGLATLFEEYLPRKLVLGLDEGSRRRHFPLDVTLWAWIFQVFDANASCRTAVNQVQSWNRAAGIDGPSSATGAYCRARAQVPLKTLEKIDKHLIERLQRYRDESLTYRGLKLKAVDGTCVQLLDTEANQEEYPQPKAQKPGCGQPVVGLMGLTELGTGALLAAEPGAGTRRDTVRANEVLDLCDAGDLLLGDRAFSGYELLATCWSRSINTLVRLHQARHKVLDWEKTGTKISKNQRLVTIHKPSQKPQKSPLTKEEWRSLPGELTLRYIRKTFTDRYKRKRELIVVTSLLDDKSHPGDELIELYHRRWEIEVSFRDIKSTMEMDLLRVKTPEMARKTIRVIKIAYNLLRLLMLETGEAPSSLSLAGVLSVVRTKHGTLNASPRLGMARRKSMISEAVELCARQRLRRRPGRHEPRCIKRRQKRYALLTKPRHEFMEPIHNGRKAA